MLTIGTGLVFLAGLVESVDRIEGLAPLELVRPPEFARGKANAVFMSV